METSTDGRAIVEATTTALLAERSDPNQFQQILTKFSEILKTNFENRNIWLRFGLTISLSGQSPYSALEAYNECMRIDQDDPLPAMLAAKLAIQDLDDPDRGLQLIEEANKRCAALPNGYKDINLIHSRCYTMASIMHAYIYEREPDSIKTTKMDHLEASLKFLDLAIETNPNDHLAYFHIALHQAKQRTYPTAIDNLRKSLQLKPSHIPSMQLLILSLSAMKCYNEALMLCESTLYEYEDNILLLYIKCNLEQYLVETKGYKSALDTAQHILKRLRSIKEDDNRKMNSQDFLDGELSIWVLVAEIFIKIGSVDDAEMCAVEGSNCSSCDFSYHVMYMRGLVAKARSDLIEAKTFFRTCLALQPRHAKALQQVGHVHYLLGNFSTAEKFLVDSLDLDGDCSKTWHYLSLVYNELNQLDKASESDKKSTALENSSPVVAFSAIPRLVLE